MKLSHRVRTSASPAEVWAVLADPQRWPEFDLFLRKVRGAHGRATTGQHLLGVARVASLRIPLDILEAVPEKRLVILVHTAPGLRETVTTEITPTVRGGSDIVASVVVEGLWARAGALPLWMASALNLRLLATLTERAVRKQRRERSA
ncbi:MAG: Polyketide cyclase / dehydrase and lipid transport [Frankiales bacterium]|nr:Polyketide cyclase / dehydrase and lipid transport [Frankiales bacterium]